MTGLYPLRGGRGSVGQRPGRGEDWARVRSKGRASCGIGWPGLVGVELDIEVGVLRNRVSRGDFAVRWRWGALWQGRGLSWPLLQGLLRFSLPLFLHSFSLFFLSLFHPFIFIMSKPNFYFIANAHILMPNPPSFSNLHLS